ncbi:hypothetical protein R3P38DRAFT_3565644 [Favolaschia claudopus]|uniref:Arrestin-like N-terminal domain-containing protein n=1 Tax=Favolaschia claudopus TaxID=2862362 RepID=A0AAW0DTS1_9AGAR
MSMSTDAMNRLPSYSAEPGYAEQRLALNPPPTTLPSPSGTFSKSSKHDDITLHLTAQEENAEIPVYGRGANVEGTIELGKTKSVASVEVTLQGYLELKETGESGHVRHILCSETVTLWTRNSSEDGGNDICPSSLPFSLVLPTEFEHDGQTYPLPPSYSAKLDTFPGFFAVADYSISAVLNKPHAITSKTLGLNIGNAVVSTSFNYHPRTRPAHRIPPPLQYIASGGFIEQPEWHVRQSTLKANPTANGVQDICVKFYLPTSRIFCAAQSIPFHITFESDAHSLAMFVPYGPVVDSNSKKGPATRVQVVRQTAVDVKHAEKARSEHGKTAIWHVDYLGDATFKHERDGPTRTSFSGELKIEPSIGVTGFSVPGLSVTDCITLTTEVEVNGPFMGILREVIPIQLTTDPWLDEGMLRKENL